MEDNRERVIYKIRNKVNNKCYIGMSVNYEQRWKQHKSNPPTKMKEDVGKYGWDNFEFSLVIDGILGGQDIAFEHEIEQISKLHPEYNSTKGGEGFGLVYGEEVWNSKLKDIDIPVIRKRAENGESYASISKDYPVEAESIARICIGELWTHLGGPIQEKNNCLGENNKTSKWKEKDIIDIRIRVHNGERKAVLAKEYDMSEVNIGDITCGNTWKNTSGPLTKKTNCTGENHHASKVTEKDVLEMRNRVGNGESYIQVKKDYPINKDTFYNIIHGKTWKSVGGKIQPVIKQKRFDEKTVIEIRERAAFGELASSIVNDYDIKVRAIYNIINGTSYSKFGGPLT